MNITRLATWIERCLNEATLGFFALVSLFLFVTPHVFSLSPTAESIITASEYTIILLFSFEYFAAMILAQNRTRFVLDGWRLIDALIIFSAIITMIPWVPDILRHSPVFRLLRIGRVALMGARSSLALKPGESPADTIAKGAATDLTVLSLGSSGSQFDAISWDEGLSRIRSAEPDWLFITGVTESRLPPIAQALGVPVSAVQGLFRSASPGFDTLEHFSTFFVRQPLPLQPGQRLQRTPILLVGTAENVVVLSRDQTDLDEKVKARLATINSSTPRIVRATLALVSEILAAYADVVESMEINLVNLEIAQANMGDEVFLARTFELRADILKVRGSLKHLKSMIRDLSNGKLIIANASVSDREPFGFLADDASDMYDEIEDLHESLQGLVDLRLNVSSFQMNRVMRLLALLTALALIPATAGGLLGMNLADTPWPGTLAQVAFGVGAGMTLSLYIFAIKGWLR